MHPDLAYIHEGKRTLLFQKGSFFCGHASGIEPPSQLTDDAHTKHQRRLEIRDTRETHKQKTPEFTALGAPKDSDGMVVGCVKKRLFSPLARRSLGLHGKPCPQGIQKGFICKVAQRPRLNLENLSSYVDHF